MIRVVLVPPSDYTDAYEELSEDYRTLRASAEQAGGVAKLVADPDVSDVVLFVGSRDPLQCDVRRHELALRFPSRVVLYDSGDRVIPIVRGIYPSIERRYWHRRRAVGGFYLRYLGNEEMEPAGFDRRPSRLFSFVGASVTNRVRREVLAIRHPRALLRDSTAEAGRGHGATAQVYTDYRRNYVSDLASAAFVLCPRGAGPSTMRIFEAMRLGRAPVIVSDAWVPPAGPAWESFAVRVPEREVPDIPARLEALEGDSARMGNLARLEWEQWFSPKSAFATIASWSRELVRNSWTRERCDRVLVRWQLLRPHFFRHVLLSRMWKRSMAATRSSIARLVGRG